ncbi:MAG: helix-turn-helix transcriptional regulator [Actinomycetales bacterium]|nr:helix-turn-helix transcriptional regulator [Actinomycetales bacterium]
MTQFRATEAAALLGVSDDTIRRWIDAGRLPAVRDGAGRWVLVGRDLAEFAREHATTPQVESDVRSSSRNRMPGLVTRVVRDGVMAQVEIQAGPFRLVSLMTREAADELGLEPGVLAVASVKSTNVVVETTRRAR